MLKLINSIKKGQKRGKQIREYLLKRFEILKMECIANGEQNILDGINIVLSIVRKTAF